MDKIEYNDLLTKTSTANACYKDAADLHADLEEYPQAIARYEQVANHSLISALTKYSVKEYWLRAGLSALATNVGSSFISRFQTLSGYSGHCVYETKPHEIFKSRCDI